MVAVKIGNIMLQWNSNAKLIILAIVAEMKWRMWECGGSYLACGVF